MRARLIAIAFACSALVVACGGGGGGGGTVLPTTNPAPTSTIGSPGSTQAVKFMLTIPLSGSTSSSRHRNFVSSATDGALIAVSGPGGANASAAVDLSSSSNACTTSGGTRTCTVTITVPLGNDTFTITTYNASPVNGAFPSGAQELGVGSASADITASTSSVDISISGLIANLGSLPAFSSLPADGATHQVPIILAPTDFGNQPIVAGTSDPYANPITVTLTESGGSGHAHLVFDGAPAPGTSVTLKYSTDTVTLQYDGGGAPGYSMSIAASASGVATTTAVIGPLYVAGSSLSANVLTLTAPGTPVTITITEAGAPGSRQYSAGASSACTNVATATSVSGVGPSATFTVTGGTMPSQDVCTILVSDGSVYLNLAVTNEPNGVTPSPTPTPTATPTPTPTPVTGTGGVTIDGYAFTTQGLTISGATLSQIVAGPEGNMWFCSTTQGIFGYTNASNTTAITEQFTVGPTTAGNVQSLAVASDGNVYFADQEDGDILLVNPVTAQQSVLQSPISIIPVAIVSAPDGNIYFTDNQNDAIYALSVAGQFTEYTVGDFYTWMTVGPDNALWLVDGAGEVARFDLSSHTITSTTAISAGNATSIATDGTNMWVTTTGTQVVRFAPASPGTQSAFANGTTAGSQGIAQGADGAMWYAVPSKNAVVRMAIATQATTVFTLTPSVPWDVAIGHDGSIWFVDKANAQLDHLSP